MWFFLSAGRTADCNSALSILVPTTPTFLPLKIPDFAMAEIICGSNALAGGLTENAGAEPAGSRAGKQRVDDSRLVRCRVALRIQRLKSDKDIVVLGQGSCTP